MILFTFGKDLFGSHVKNGRVQVVAGGLSTA